MLAVSEPVKKVIAGDMPLEDARRQPRGCRVYIATTVDYCRL